MSVSRYVRSSVYKKFFSDFNEILYVDRGRWANERCTMVWYAVWPDPRSRLQGFWSSNNCTFQGLSHLPFTMGADKWPL